MAEDWHGKTMKGVFVKLKLLKHMFLFSQPSLSIKSQTFIRKKPPNKFSNIPSVFPMCIFIFPSFHPFSSMLPMFPSIFIHVLYLSILFAINFVRPHPFFSEYKCYVFAPRHLAADKGETESRAVGLGQDESRVLVGCTLDLPGKKNEDTRANP